MNTEYTLRGSERFTRTIIGLCLALSILFLPLTPTWIALISLASMYPLLTALTAIDPLYMLIDYTLYPIGPPTMFQQMKHA